MSMTFGRVMMMAISLSQMAVSLLVNPNRGFLAPRDLEWDFTGMYVNPQNGAQYRIAHGSFNNDLLQIEGEEKDGGKWYGSAEVDGSTLVADLSHMPQGQSGLSGSAVDTGILWQDGSMWDKK